MALISTVRERIVSEMMPAHWLAYLVVSFLAMRVTEFEKVHCGFGFGKTELLVPLRYHEDRSLIFLIHCCIPNA